MDFQDKSSFCFNTENLPWLVRRGGFLSFSQVFTTYSHPAPVPHEPATLRHRFMVTAVPHRPSSGIKPECLSRHTGGFSPHRPGLGTAYFHIRWKLSCSVLPRPRLQGRCQPALQLLYTMG